MGTAIFPHSADLDRIVGHALDNGLDVLLVHDRGLYLMVQTLRLSDGSQAVCVYAEGCHPDDDSTGWYDTARDIAGGDDFVEQFDPRHIAPLIADQHGLKLEISETHINMTAHVAAPKEIAP